MTDPDIKETLLRETREELARADGKASILLAASGIAFAALLTVGHSSSWYPDKLHDRPARFFAWAALALTLAGICLVAAAVKPRLRATRPKDPDIHYFADVEAYWPRWWNIRRRTVARDRGRDRFTAALRRTAQTQRYDERVVDQIWNLSHIAYRKYRLVSIGMWLYAGAIAAAVVALVVEKEWL